MWKLKDHWTIINNNLIKIKWIIKYWPIFFKLIKLKWIRWCKKAEGIKFRKKLIKWEIEIVFGKFLKAKYNNVN
jgi:hypothetical protein